MTDPAGLPPPDAYAIMDAAVKRYAARFGQAPAVRQFLGQPPAWPGAAAGGRGWLMQACSSSAGSGQAATGRFAAGKLNRPSG